MSGRDELIARAKERAETTPTPEEWGYRITLEEGESFVGRWRGQTVDEDNSNRSIYLFWDESSEWCFSRSYASLDRELDREQPAIGATVVIYRGDNYKTQYDDEGEASGQSFGVTVEPNDDLLPGEPVPSETASSADTQLADDEDLGF